ncbi:MAG TPA: hypothetical protein VFO40_23075, partial [Chthoniobacterales bacterium]|nr:hypothetical protein [Chthoniobacterales bacterium]
ALKKAIESAPTDSPGNVGEVNAGFGEPPKKRLRNAIQIGSIIFLFIVLGAVIYLSMAGH